jgi:hypothetical protein
LSFSLRFVFILVFSTISTIVLFAPPGYSTSSIKIVNKMLGKADAYWSRDGVKWTKINYEEGGGTSTVPFFSSQEWAQTVVDTKTKYLGLWGLTVAQFNSSTHTEVSWYLFGGFDCI